MNTNHKNAENAGLPRDFVIIPGPGSGQWNVQALGHGVASPEAIRVREVATDPPVTISDQATRLRAAARLLHDALADPDSAPGMVKNWHAAWDAMRDDHAENMKICGEEDWPSTLLAALEAFANPPEEGQN